MEPPLNSSLMSVINRNVMSSQDVVDFVSQKIKPDASGVARPLSSIVEEVRDIAFLIYIFLLDPSVCPPVCITFFIL